MSPGRGSLRAETQREGGDPEVWLLCAVVSAAVVSAAEAGAQPLSRVSKTVRAAMTT